MSVFRILYLFRLFDLFKYFFKICCLLQYFITNFAYGIDLFRYYDSKIQDLTYDRIIYSRNFFLNIRKILFYIIICFKIQILI